jgi:hypothetical protein
MKRARPSLKEYKKEVIRGKVRKFIKKGYVSPPEGKVKSLIKYFAVPKGVLERVVQDWRMVFHAGANKLNDCVWDPSFTLSLLNSLLRIIDSNSLQEDRDKGEMFLNFQLDPKIQPFSTIDVGPLELPSDE